MKIIVAYFVAVLLWLSDIVSTVAAFTQRSQISTTRFVRPKFQPELQHDAVLDIANSRKSLTNPYIPLLSTFVTIVPSVSFAATEVELADLPPPWIPVVFGLGLVVGVGLLTGSLGDVIEQESQLGLQSGARAKKEIDRSRSSYFKKK